MTAATRGFRLSVQQAQIWAETRGDLEARVSCQVQIDGPLDVEKLREAIQFQSQRHEILRTSFRTESGTPFQVIGEPNESSLFAPSIESRGPESHVLTLSLPRLCADRRSLCNLV